MKIIKLFCLIISVNLLTAYTGYPQNWSANGIKGEGPKVTKTLDISSFDGIGLAISGDVYLKQGNRQSVKIEAQQNIIDNLLTKVENGTWKIKFDKNVRQHEDVKIWITVPNLKKVSVSGSGDVIGESAFKNLDDLSLAVSGSGKIQLDADSKSSSIAVSGSGKMKLAGQTAKCSIAISGSGDIDAFDLASQTCSVVISGSGDASVNASDDLNVVIAGSGDVLYKGNARVKSKISGSGDVRSN